MNRALAALSIAALATTVHAQTADHPSFAGQWSTETAAPPAGAPARGVAPGGRGGAAQPSMGSGWGPTITIGQSSAELTVEYAFFTRGDMQPPLRFTYVFGASHKNTVMMGRGIQEQTSKTEWKGDTLVITTEHSFPDPASGKPMPYSVKQSLVLSSPTTLVVQTNRPEILGGAASSTITTYTKR